MTTDRFPDMRPMTAETRAKLERATFDRLNQRLGKVGYSLKPKWRRTLSRLVDEIADVMKHKGVSQLEPIDETKTQAFVDELAKHTADAVESHAMAAAWRNEKPMQ
jgi:hypothetical protein